MHFYAYDRGRGCKTDIPRAGLTQGQNNSKWLTNATKAVESHPEKDEQDDVSKFGESIEI